MISSRAVNLQRVDREGVPHRSVGSLVQEEGQGELSFLPFARGDIFSGHADFFDRKGYGSGRSQVFHPNRELFKGQFPQGGKPGLLRRGFLLRPLEEGREGPSGLGLRP